MQTDSTTQNSALDCSSLFAEDECGRRRVSARKLERNRKVFFDVPNGSPILRTMIFGDVQAIMILSLLQRNK